MNRDEIRRLLPSVFRRTLEELEVDGARDSPLHGVLEVMEALHAPSEAVLDKLDVFFDPRRSPEAFVPFLAAWVDLADLVGAGGEARRHAIRPGPLRELVCRASWLSRWRGTTKGLLAFLSTATGVHGFEIRENVTGTGEPRDFHLLVRAPPAARSQEALVRRVVEREKPAYVTHEVEWGEESADPEESDDEPP